MIEPQQTEMRCGRRLSFEMASVLEAIAEKVHRGLNLAVCILSVGPLRGERASAFLGKSCRFDHVLDGVPANVRHQNLLWRRWSRVEAKEPPPPPDLALLFRRKVERLEETLNAEPDVITKAAPILRTLIDGIVLHPRKKRGTMPIEVYGEPSALFLMADEEPPSAASRMITVVAEERIRRNQPFLKIDV